MSLNRLLFCLLATGSLLGCDDDPPPDPEPFESEYLDSGPLCEPLATDYSPGQEDSWPACESADTGQYVPFDFNISTISRVASFEAIATLLFDPTTDSTSDEFTEARLEYQSAEGLGSRVDRRYDPHFTVPEGAGTECEDDVLEKYPDYCVGPAHLQPLLLAAFNAGIAGDQPRVQAAKIEAALLWFFYVSVHKESLTCGTSKIQDCDSSYAYYSGGEVDESDEDALGFARYLQEVAPDTHARVWDGILAVHCWRENDNPSGIAADDARRDLARTQTDRAALDGVISILRDRLNNFEASTGAEQAYYWAFVQTLAPVIYPAADARDQSSASILRSEFAKTDTGTVDIDAIVTALDSITAC